MICFSFSFRPFPLVGQWSWCTFDIVNKFQWNKNSKQSFISS